MAVLYTTEHTQCFLLRWPLEWSLINIFNKELYWWCCQLLCVVILRFNSDNIAVVDILKKRCGGMDPSVLPILTFSTLPSMYQVFLILQQTQYPAITHLNFLLFSTAADQDASVTG